MKDFTGYTVKSKQYDYLNGRTVVKTIKQIKTKTGRNLYEVLLNHNKRRYQLYEDELIKKGERSLDGRYIYRT